MIYWVFFLQSAVGTIVSFTQYINLVDSSFSCQSGYQTTKTVSFGDTFDYIPQVFIINTRLDYSHPAEFKMNIESITKTNFILKFSCSTQRIWSVELIVMAFSDKRLQVFSSFNMNNPTDIVFQKKDVNAVNSFISVLSYSLAGAFNFYLQVIDLSPYEFKVALVQDSTTTANLKQIGYQVLIGTEEALKVYQKYTSTTAFTSSTSNSIPNYQYLYALQGFNYQYSDNIRLEFTYISSGGNEQYNLKAMSGVFTPNVNQACHCKFDGFTTPAPEYSCFTLRISRKELIGYDQQSQMLLTIIDMNKSYNTLGTFILVLDKEITPLQISFEYKCIQGKIVKAQFNKCSTCVGKSKSYIENKVCYNSKQLISFFPKYRTNTQFKGNLKILFESSKITITQLLYNHVEAEVVIAVVEYIEQ